jgi:hypothetical protein
MNYKYDIGDIIKIKFHNEIKYAVIIDHQIVIGKQAYQYIIQGLEAKTYWDTEYNLELRIKGYLNEQQIQYR